jgi:hypothetical protein
MRETRVEPWITEAIARVCHWLMGKRVDSIIKALIEFGEIQLRRFAAGDETGQQMIRLRASLITERTRELYARSTGVKASLWHHPQNTVVGRTSGRRIETKRRT